MKTIPYSSGLPFLGHLFSYQRDRLSLLKRMKQKQGPVFRLRVGSKELIVTFRASDVKRIMQDNWGNYIKQMSLDRIFGQGVFNTNGDIWSSHRKVLQPLFSSAYLDGIAPSVWSIAKEHIDHELTRSSGQTIDLHPLFERITFDIIVTAVIGLDFRSHFNELKEAFEFLTSFYTRDHYWPSALSRIFSRDDRERADAYLRSIDEIVYAAIRDPATKRSSNSIAGLLLKARDEQKINELNDTVIRDEVVTLIFAGFETTALTLSWASYVLARDGHLQTTLRKEMAHVGAFKLRDRETLRKLDKTSAFISEVLRLYPPGWAWTRVAVEDDNLGEYSVQSGDRILIVPYWMHRDPEYFDDPETFRPERFLESERHPLQKYAYIPFGVGPRQCLGGALASLELNAILATLLKESMLEQPIKPIEDPVVTLRSSNGFQLRWSRRSEASRD